MKKINGFVFLQGALALLLGWMPSAAMAGEGQEDSVYYGTFIKNDVTIYYGMHDGVTVTVDVTDGIGQPEISISNESRSAFDFDPMQTRVSVYRLPASAGRFKNQVGLFRMTKADLKEMPCDTLSVIPYAKYVSKTRRSQFWADMVYNMVLAVDYTASGKNGDMIAYLENQRLDDVNRAELRRIDEGYWRTNTIFPNTSHKGFIGIKKLKADHLILDIPVNGTNYHFEILPSKVK